MHMSQVPDPAVENVSRSSITNVVLILGGHPENRAKNYGSRFCSIEVPGFFRNSHIEVYCLSIPIAMAL